MPRPAIPRRPPRGSIKAVLAWAAAVLIGTGLLSAASPESSLERQTFDLVNAYRQQQQLTPLQWSADAAAQARRHSLDMATGACDFGHDGFRDRVAALREIIPGVNGAGENVFETSDANAVVESAVDHWLHSPPHLHNIRGDFVLSGVGLARAADGTWYFTQIFLKVSRLPPEPATAFPGATSPSLPLAPPIPTR